jgi:hypothetical protein
MELGTDFDQSHIRILDLLNHVCTLRHHVPLCMCQLRQCVSRRLDNRGRVLGLNGHDPRACCLLNIGRSSLGVYVILASVSRRLPKS